MGSSMGSSVGSSAPAAPPASAEDLLRCQFDRVLLDAPCSGTGVLAKRADLRWRRQPGDLRQLASLQVNGRGLLPLMACGHCYIPWC